jgi:hypothetical protein
MKCTICSLNYESTSSAMVTTSANTLLKSTVSIFFSRVSKILTYRMRDFSTTAGTAYPCWWRSTPW